MVHDAPTFVCQPCADAKLKYCTFKRRDGLKKHERISCPFNEESEKNKKKRADAEAAAAARHDQ